MGAVNSQSKGGERLPSRLASLQSVDCRACDLNILLAISAAHADRADQLAIDHEWDAATIPGSMG
jgi:hypothetical protein